MDFQTLNRRELQALCKLNKIPANVTNIAMVDALKSLETVEGIEEFLNPSRSETIGSSNESPERIQATSVRVPRTTCRTSTRQKANNSETESLHATASRATSRGVRRQLDGEVNEFLKTPMVSSIRKKGTTTSTHQEALKKETTTTTTTTNTTVQRAYSTRRSTRLTAKKSEGLEVIDRERSEPIKLDSFLDEVKDLGNQSDENSKNEKEVVHVDTTTLESGEKKVDCCGEVDDLKVKSDEIIEQHENVDLEDLKPDSEPCEDDDSEEKWVIIDEKIDLNEAPNVSVKEQDATFMVAEEQTVKADDIDDNALSFNTENPSDPSILKPESMPCVVSEMKNEESEYNGNLNSEIPKEPLKLDNHNVDEVMTAEGIDENISENKVDFGETQESLMEEVDVDEVTHESFMKEGNKSSDNKENEENINEKEGDGDENVKKNLNDTSLRQLKKQLKALTIKSKDASCVTTTEMEN
ncbi:unnamed protein product [Lactuca saligna]|uniref:Uncharacterized protein n=1 Tax=Lactuca saligna TaxID=75948 RepID=A0AA35YK97_LACSI|nr:unnamed protein product [Lactuca saligna]